MVKRRKVLAFHIVVQSGYASCIFRLFKLVVSVILLSKFGSLERDHGSTG